MRECWCNESDVTCDKCVKNIVASAVEEKEAELSHGRQSRALIIAADARKAAFKEWDAKYGFVHAENCSKYGYCDISTPCTCGLDDLRKEMEVSDDKRE